MCLAVENQMEEMASCLLFISRLFLDFGLGSTLDISNSNSTHFRLYIVKYPENTITLCVYVLCSYTVSAMVQHSVYTKTLKAMRNFFLILTTRRNNLFSPRWISASMFCNPLRQKNKTKSEYDEHVYEWVTDCQHVCT